MTDPVCPRSPDPDLTIVHPWDPWGQGIGGFDTFLDTFIRHLPSDLGVELVGITTDSGQRPVGRWLQRPFAGREVRFFAAARDSEPDRVRRLPLSLRFVAACLLRRVRASGPVVQFHRFESAFGVRLLAGVRKVFFLHNHPREIRSPFSDVRWRRLSGLHDRLLLGQLATASAVVAVDPRTPAWLAAHLPAMRGPVLHQRKWAERTACSSPAPATVERERRELRAAAGAAPDDRIVAFVGRLESQKDPLLMLEAFAVVLRRRPGTWLVVAGKGRLEAAMRSRAAALGIANRVRFLGAVPRDRLPAVYRGADVLGCTSAYEAGPLTVFESLACGTPVVSVDVGQVATVLRHHPEAGGLVEGRDPAEIADALGKVLDREPLPTLRASCAASVAPLTPERAFAPILDLYGAWLGDAARGDRAEERHGSLASSAGPGGVASSPATTPTQP